MFSFVYGVLLGIVMLIFIGISLFLLLCMNVFTLPLTLLAFLLCKLLRRPRPRCRLYGLMVYPSWKANSNVSFTNSLSRYFERQRKKDAEKARRRFRVTHAWEERFFR